MKRTIPNVLLVEDNEADQKITVDLLGEGAWKPISYVVGDGEEAIQFLNKTGKFSAAPRPDLILLDLNLPKIDGRQVLKHVKNDPSLRVIPVVVLTTSESREDLSFCYNNDTNAYVVKPVGIEEFISTIHEIKEFWLRRVTPCPAAQSAPN